MLLSMAAVAYCDKPLDWLAADILRCVLLVMNLRRTVSAINASVSITLQDKCSLTFPIIGLQVVLAIIGSAVFPSFIPLPLVHDHSNPGEYAR
jgi:hypothetical protein